jgi:hypothetical protein
MRFTLPLRPRRRFLRLVADLPSVAPFGFDLKLAEELETLL